jgi:beta-lactamase regulating signal transducer with metallopeptidase domain
MPVQYCFRPASSPWFESALVLAVGTAVIVALAALAGWGVRSAVWRRTIWQVTTFGLLAWVFVEWTGTGPAVVWLCRARPQPAATAESLGNASANLFLSFWERAGSNSSLSLWERRLTSDGDWLSKGADFAETAPGLPSAGTCHAENAPRLPLAKTWRAENAPGLPSRGFGAPASENPPSEDGISDGGAARVRGTQLSRGRWPALIWAFGAAAVVVRIGWAQVLLSAFRRRCAALCDPAVRRRVDALARRLGMRRAVCLLAGDGLSAPVAFGSVFPTIVLPPKFAEDFDAGQQEAMLAHELAHLAAGDSAWQLLAGLLCAALWWHPLAWWTRHCLRAASEAAADEASLLVPDGPSVLAAGLVALGRRLASSRRLGWLSVEGRGFRSGLGRRVERLLSLRAGSWRAPGRGRLLAAKTALPVVLVLAAISCTAWARPQAPLAEGETTMSVLKTSWRYSLAATALWALLGPSPASATADDTAADKPKPAATEQPQAVQPSGLAQVELALAEGHESKEGEAREGPKRDRPRGEAREGARREGREAGPPPEELMRHAREFQEKAREIDQRLGKLRPEQDAEARELKEQLGRILQELRQMPPPRGPRDAGPGPRPEMGRMGPPSPEAMEEMQRRAKHLLEAAENLRAAGLPGEADRFTQMVERLKRGEPEGPRPPEGPGRPGAGGGMGFGGMSGGGRGVVGQPGPGGGMGFGFGMSGGGRGVVLRSGPEGRAGVGPAPGGPVPPGAPPGPGGPMPPGGMMGPELPPLPEVARAVKDIGAEVERMRREMQELREQLKQLLEREHGEKR